MQILQVLTHHKNVVKLYDSFETNTHLCFVMELCAGGDILGFVRRRKKLDDATCYLQPPFLVFRQILISNHLSLVDSPLLCRTTFFAAADDSGDAGGER